jgi:hypothetical protein
VKVLIEKQMPDATVHALGNNPKEETPVDFGGARNDPATVIVGRPHMLHLKRVAATRAFDVPNIFMLFGCSGFRLCAGSKMLGTWDHRDALR